MDASDLVQETSLEAHRNFPKFQGVSEPQFLCWLRQIMAANLANLLRRYLGTQGRDVRLERELAVRLDRRRGCSTAGWSTRGSRRASRRPAANRPCCWPTPWSGFPRLPRSDHAAAFRGVDVSGSQPPHGAIAG